MLIKSTKAAILVESNKPLVVASIELPNDLLHGQVLVKVVYSGICGAQINEIEAAKGPDKFLPHLLGHEGSGMVLDVGPGVTSVKQGDHVVMHWRPSQGIQSETPKYSWKDNLVNAGWVTTFNEFAVLSENRLTVIPKEFDLKLAPLLGCAVTTAMGVINNDAHVKIGQSVVIFGVGGVGLNIAQAANMVSAHPIVGIDLSQTKLEMAKKFGVTNAFVGGNNLENCVETIREVVGKQGADVVVDTTGNARVIESAYELTHPDGKTILVGVPRKGDNISIYSLPLHFNKVLTGSEGGGSIPHVDIPRYIRLHQAGQFNLDGLVTHEFSLDEVNDAIDVVRSGECGRCMIDMSL
ncbi:MAG: dehydrogenase [Anaerolineaceae bacterium]|nr:dehydrogenase [Anaerolineaceae bacterium]|tara:strand:- start:892 stop:1947 length:1056 start_codon:yes stop_codon:yes gene_type:complete